MPSPPLFDRTVSERTVSERTVFDRTVTDKTPRPASGALTKTGGFLGAFSHTLQPYIGCQFGCEYCYVKGLLVHRFHQPKLDWGAYVHPRIGIADKLRKEMARSAKMDQLDDLAIYMSSATDPYQAAERTWRLSRACLRVFQDFAPRLLVVQTRSPFVRDDFDLLRELGERAWLNVTLETDTDDVRRAVTPLCPSIAQRVEALKLARAAGVNVQVTVSPCLPFSSVEKFGALLLELGDRIVVDTFTSGDGQGGKRTKRTDTPKLFEQNGWRDWQSEENARSLFEWLMQYGDRPIGWSESGFNELASLDERN